MTRPSSRRRRRLLIRRKPVVTVSTWETRALLSRRALDGGYIQAGLRRFAWCILMNPPSHLVFQRCESLRQKGGCTGSRGGSRGRRWRRGRRGERRWGGPEPEMAARWLLLALLAAHAAALPDIIRIGEYLSRPPLPRLKASLFHPSPHFISRFSLFPSVFLCFSFALSLSLLRAFPVSPISFRASFTRCPR